MTNFEANPNIDPNKPVWPSGERQAILEVSCELSDLTLKYGLKFQRMYDGLDWFYGGLIHHIHLGYVGFIKYDGLPTGGTIVYLDANVAHHLTDIECVISELDMPESWIIWKSSMEWNTNSE